MSTTNRHILIFPVKSIKINSLRNNLSNFAGGNLIFCLIIMAKATTCKEAIQRWEEKTGLIASEQKEIILSFQWPPIERMDNNLATLINVEKLSLSTNMIEKISGINSLKYLKILSLSRNNIKTFSGLEAIGDHLEELWISYNLIEKIKGVNALKALKVLYMGNNLVKDWAEFNRLQEIPNLQDLLFINNPICENMDAESWRAQVVKRLPTLKKIDAIPIVYAMCSLILSFIEPRDATFKPIVKLFFLFQPCR